MNKGEEKENYQKYLEKHKKNLLEFINKKNEK